jgi:signal transduction histidine kinase
VNLAGRGRRALFTGLLVLAVAALLASSVLSLRTTDRLAVSIASVSQTQRVIEQINRLWGLLGDRDSEVLRYLLLGRDEQLEAFRDTVRRMEAARSQLAGETRGDPVQAAALAELGRLHEERIERAEQLVALKQRAVAGDAAAAARLDREFDGSPTSGNAEAMRAILEGMVQHERDRLALQRAQRELTIRHNRRIVLAANGLALVAGLTALLAIGRLRRREREAERAAFEAQQARSIASERQASLELVAHDLRGHFGNLLFASDLVRDAAAPEARARLAASVRGSAASGLLFLQAVLEQAAGEARGEAVGALDLGAELRRVLEEFATPAAARGIRFARHGDDGLQLRGQPLALAHVLRNLVSNAVKFAPEGGLVEFDLETLPDRGRLRVLDRGPGVPEAERGALFQRYVPLSPTPGGAAPASTGLGLALARQHARAQGGELRYEPRAGGGACFVLEWPRA